MQVWSIVYDQTDFPDSVRDLEPLFLTALTDDGQLYQSALPLVDQPARSKITRFHRREDACRSLIGSLLPRVLLRKRGIPRDAISFAVTDTGKPYSTTPGLDPPLGFNVTHDEGVVAMAFATGDLGPPAYNIGVDVMQLKVPPRSTFAQLIDSVSSQLTPLEQTLLRADVPESEAIRRFYWVWTLKEACTKALGIGLGFDFRRIEYDVVKEDVTIDGEPARGWQFRRFEVAHTGSRYVGVAARFIGGRNVSLGELDEGSLVCYDAVSFVQRAIEELA